MTKQTLSDLRRFLATVFLAATLCSMPALVDAGPQRYFDSQVYESDTIVQARVLEVELLRVRDDNIGLYGVRLLVEESLRGKRNKGEVAYLYVVCSASAELATELPVETFDSMINTVLYGAPEAPLVGTSYLLFAKTFDPDTLVLARNDANYLVQPSEAELIAVRASASYGYYPPY